MKCNQGWEAIFGTDRIEYREHDRAVVFMAESLPGGGHVIYQNTFQEKGCTGRFGPADVKMALERLGEGAKFLEIELDGA